MDDKKQQETFDSLFPTKELTASGQRIGEIVSSLIAPGTISKEKIASAAAEIQKELNGIFLLGSQFGYKQCLVDSGFLTVEEAKAMGKGGQS